MKKSQIFILFLIGTALILSGVYFKRQDEKIASLLLIVGITFETVAILAMLVKRMTKNNKDHSSDH